MHELFGHREILARDNLKLHAALRVLLKLRCRGARFRADRRAARQKQREQRDAVEIRGLRQVAVPDDIGMAGSLRCQRSIKRNARSYKGAPLPSSAYDPSSWRVTATTPR